MKPSKVKPRRAHNSTIAQSTRPIPKRSAKALLAAAKDLVPVGQTYLPISVLPKDRELAIRSGSQIKKSATPIRKKKRTPSEFNRIYGSKARVQFVKHLPCIACVSISPVFALATAGWSDNAHTVTGGMGHKADYTTIVPLCRGHHSAFDLHRRPFNTEQARDAIRRDAERVEALWQSHQRETVKHRANWSR